VSYGNAQLLRVKREVTYAGTPKQSKLQSVGRVLKERDLPDDALFDAKLFSESDLSPKQSRSLRVGAKVLAYTGLALGIGLVAHTANERSSQADNAPAVETILEQSIVSPSAPFEVNNQQVSVSAIQLENLRP
jgi:hypothetical protein